MKKIFEYLKPQTKFIIFVLIIKFIGTIMDLLIPWTLGKIIDDVVPSCTADDLTPIFKWGALMIMFSVIAFVGSTVANRGASKIATHTTGKLRSDLFEKILSLSSNQIDNVTVPSLVSRMSTDTYFVDGMLSDVLRAGLRAPILLIGGIAVTLTIEPVLSLAFIVLLPILAAISIYISKKGYQKFKEKQFAADEMVKVVRDDFAGIRVIKALSKTDHEKKHFSDVNLALSEKERIAGVTVAATKPVVSMFLNFAMSAVIVIGAFRVYDGKALPGQIISFLSYINIMLNATIMVSRIFTTISRGAASADRIQKVFDTESDITVIPSEKESDSAFIEFRNVSFRYRSKKTNTLENISFKLQKGETLGIIGGTGSGKSTVISLLLRLYDVDEGQILIEGRDIRSIPLGELYSKFGVTFQNDFIFSDTIAENIRFERGIDKAEIEEAAFVAQASEFIRKIEDQFDYKLYSKGSNVSGGQKQRILISRAVAGDADILILDDASSALDYKTDAKLREEIKNSCKGKTVIVVAQRVSSIRMSDVIVVLDHGKMIGIGNDDSLMQSCSVYKEIAYSQMGEFDV